MACCKSMLIRRLLLWYILLGSFVILPLSWEVFNGCKMIEIDSQSYGLFKRAVFDSEGFIGCVDYSSHPSFEDDLLFKIARTAGLCMVMFATLASVICLFIQCFCKAGKSKLWIVMRLTFFLAFASQGTTAIIYFADICENADQCAIGPNGYHAAVNAFFLCVMVIATLSSSPPRNPVFRLWYDLPDYDTDQADSYDEDDVETGNPGDAEDSVSLFGESIRSARRNLKKSTNSVASPTKSRRKMGAIAEAKNKTEPDGRSYVGTAKSPATNGVSLSETSFQRHVQEMIDHGVALGPGGIREDERRHGDQFIIVDKYPGSLLNDAPVETDGTDVVKIRSEYCPVGRKTIREECHPDGSRTVTTTITIVKDDSVIAGIDP
eukprot:scaffold1119_cov120-Cylindrotheca_fusiformis.AAC.5